MTLEVMSVTETDLETHADVIKVAIVAALKTEGCLTLTHEQADIWCAEHTVKIRRKSWWRTLTARWLNEPSVDGRLCYIVVKDVR